MELKLVPITAENWRTAAFLSTDPEYRMTLEEQWLAGNAFSMLQAGFEKDWECRLMLDGDKAVGFVFFGYWRERDRYLLCRYMIDHRSQNLGYGKAFLPLVVDLIRERYGCREVYTSVHDENSRAIHLYTAFGFRPTEEMDEEERVYILKEG